MSLASETQTYDVQGDIWHGELWHIVGQNTALVQRGRGRRGRGEIEIGFRHANHHRAPHVTTCVCKTTTGVGSRLLSQVRRQDIKLRVLSQICLECCTRIQYFQRGQANTFPSSIPSVCAQSAGWGAA